MPMIFRPSAPLLLDVADPGADLGRRSGAALADERIDQDARRDDRVGVALGLPALRLVEVAADFARRGDAGGEIEIALVLDRLRDTRLALFVPVHVRVDDARHHVLAGGVDHRVRRSRRRRDRRRRPGMASAGPMYEINPSCDDDVDRAVGRLGVAVDHHRVLDDEAARRPWRGSAACAGGCCAARPNVITRGEREPCDRRASAIASDLLGSGAEREIIAFW